MPSLVGGPSSAVPEASHLGGHPLFIVASHDSLHHKELVALHVRLDGVKSIQIDPRRSERAIMRHVGWLEERDEVIQHRTLSFVRRVDGLSDYRVADSIAISELQPTMATVEERFKHWMEERISTLEQRSPGPQGLTLPPRRMRRNAIERLVADRVAEAINEYERNRANPARAGDAGPAVAGGNARGAGENARGNTRGNVAPEVRGCTYKKSLGCNPLTFGGTEGVVGLSRWIKKLESIFQISKCTNEDKVKYGACTLQGRALTWWNGYVHSLGIDVANQIPLTKFKHIMTDEYCPRNKLQRMEQEIWNLTLKGDDIAGYTNRFHKLAALCPSMITSKCKKIKRYFWGLPEKIQGNVTSSKHAAAHEAIHMTHILMDHPVQFKVARSVEANKRKWEDYQSGGNNNNNNRNNTHHHQQNRTQEVAKAYVVTLVEGKVYLGSLPLCNRCKLHHLRQCSVK
ncbi:putative reverse transcriptase domain-containing protein [Tanacetum coccineum]